MQISILIPAYNEEKTIGKVVKDFKKQFLPILRNVQVVYPQAKVKQVTGGLMLMASPPPIPKKS